MNKLIINLLLSMSLFSCDPTSSNNHPAQNPILEQKKSAVVYGNDDRLEYFQLPDGMIKQKARTSSIALMRSDSLNMQDPSNITLNQPVSLGRGNQLCDDQPFVEQPKSAFCSGTLVAPDLILTAGHCLDDEVCENLKIVFRYLYLNQNQLAPITEDQVYQCAEILHFQNDIQADYGWIRLDRPVLQPLAPTEIASDLRELAVGQSLNMMGHPNGIPLKIDQNGRITFLDQSQRSGFFNLSIDAFGGNSGSGIYDQSGKVRGILVRGRTDYEFNEQRQCNEVATAAIDANGKPLDGAAGEVATHVAFALRGLCQLYPNEPLCLNQVLPPIDPNPDPNQLLCQEDELEPNDEWTMATTLPLGQFTILNHCDDGQDYFLFSSPMNGTYDIETYPLESESDTLLSLYQGNIDQVLLEDDDSGIGYGSLIEEWQVQSNTPYFINIHSYQSQFGANRLYGVLLREHCQSDIYEHDDFPIPQIPLLTGSFQQRRSLCDEDWIAIQLEADVSYRIETLNLEQTDTLLEIYQLSGARVAQNDNRQVNDLSSDIMFTPTQTQKYWLKISNTNGYYGGNQIYDIKVSSDEKCDQIDNDLDGNIDENTGFCLSCLSDEAEPDQSISQSSPLQLGKIYQRNHCYDDIDYASLSIEDLTQSFDIEIYPYDANVDSIIDLLDNQQRILLSNDDGRGAGPGSLIDQYQFDQAGQYYLKVYEKNGNFGEGYDYGVLFREHCQDDPFEHDDWRAEAQLREGDQWRDQRALCDEDWINIQLRGGITYIIQSDDLMGVDTLIEVYQGDQIDPLVSDDDSGPGYGSRVLIYARTDVSLKIRVKTYSNFYGGLNHYWLSLNPVPQEVCDGVDNNFNGEIDEALLNACGKCGEVPLEVCDEMDNDCDGHTDESVLNACGRCGDIPLEVCDGVDNDCDGNTDENVLNACGRCGPLPSERCDDMDNDCDGKTDEGCFGYDAQLQDMDVLSDLALNDHAVAIEIDQAIEDEMIHLDRDYKIIDSRRTIDQGVVNPSKTGHLGGCQQNTFSTFSGIYLLIFMFFLRRFHLQMILLFLIFGISKNIYAQSSLCVDCHPEEVKGFLQTGMGKALYKPDASKIIENFDLQKSKVIHPVSKAIYQAIIDENGKWWQIEKSPNGQYERKVEVKYIVGSGNHTRSYIGEIDGALFELPLTWYVQKGIWDMSPGYEEKNHFRFERPIRADCIFCHNDLSQIKEYSLSTYHDFQEGISCARCHGDGRLHVKKEYEQQIKNTDIQGFFQKIKLDPRTYQNPFKTQLEKLPLIGSMIKEENQKQISIHDLQQSILGKELILNPKNLEQDRQNEICDQCHLTGNARILYQDQKWDEYDPNVPLHEYMGIYIPDRSSDAKFGISSHGERLKQSACFQKSQNPMLTCSTCHHPHQQTTRQDYQNACLSCHQNNDCKENHQKHPQDQQKNCVDCHMYRGGTSDIPHVNFTDHWIRKKPTETPVLDLGYAPLKNALKPSVSRSQNEFIAMEGLASIENARFITKNALDWQDGYQKLMIALDQVNQGRLKADPRYELSLARAEKALGLTEQSAQHYWSYLLKNPSDPIASLEGAEVLSKIGKVDQAIQVYEKIISLEPKYYQAMMDYGNLLQAQKKNEKADQIYKQALALAPHHAELWFNYGYLAVQQNQYQLARERFEIGIQKDGLKGEGYFHLGILKIRENQPQKAIEYFQKALEINPEIKEVYWIRGRLLMFSQKWAESEKDFKKLIELDPSSVSGYLDFSHLYVLQKRYQDAKRILELGMKHTDALDLIDAMNLVDVMMKHGK